MLVNLFFLFGIRRRMSGNGMFSDVGERFQDGKGSVGGVQADKKAKMTPDAGGKSVIE
jgi:hypothetical protein